jgi:RNA polymerase sigma factor (sigma-70 family)
LLFWKNLPQSGSGPESTPYIFEFGLAAAYSQVTMQPKPSTEPGDGSSLATRATLLSRLKDWNDQQSWQEFFDTYWRLIYSVALKSGLNDPAARDVVQETLLTVAKKMPEFRYDPEMGSFKSWLLTVTRSRIVDHLRRHARHAPPPASAPADDTPRTPTAHRVPDPASLQLEAVWDEEWRKNLAATALERVKRRVKPKQYQVFDCFVLRGWPMAEVQRKLKVSLAQVYFAKYKITVLLQKERARLERQWP